MRLVRIKPEYFRIFREGQWINLDNDLVVIYGPNAFGKTSISEALEWLLYGKTKRRDQGENYSPKDYKGSYRNAHAPNESETSVEVEVRLDDGTIHSVKRILRVGPRNSETSELQVDGAEGGLDNLGISDDERYYPVIAQHTLQDLIQTKPKERRDRISATLGLEALIDYKSALNKARMLMQSQPPQQVVNAKMQMTRVITVMGQTKLFQPICDRWRTAVIDLDRDYEEIMRIAGLYGQFGGLNDNQIVDALEHTRDLFVQRVFDANVIKISASWQEYMSTLEDDRLRCYEDIAVLIQSVNHFLAETNILYSNAQINIWRAGLEMDREADICPMCGESTLTDKKRMDIFGRLESSRDYSLSLEDVKNKSTIASNSLDYVYNDFCMIFPELLNEEGRQHISQLFVEDMGTCEAFLQEHDRLKNYIEQALASRNQIKDKIMVIADSVLDPRMAPATCEWLVELRRELDIIFDQAEEQIRNYISVSQTFMDCLSHIITSHETVKTLNAVIEAITLRTEIKIVAAYTIIMDETLNLIRGIEEYIKVKQAEVFANRGQDIFSWYDMMNPGALVKYHRMEAGTDSLTIWAQSDGTDINAVSCLSQCQLNCLGLSFHFMRVTTHGMPFAFLILDDPVQSMDDDHCQAVITTVLNDLIETWGFQIIIFSHVKAFTDSIRDTYFYKLPLRLAIVGFNQTHGPEIEFDETLSELLRRVRSMATGSQFDRQLAVDVIRRCAELLIRDVCRQTGSPPPPGNATASQMLPYFRVCRGTTQQQIQGIQQTIQFADPAHHTQIGWAVPTQPQILPHADRIQTIARDLGIT